MCASLSVGPVALTTPPLASFVLADGAGHSGHELYHLTHWLADPPLPAEDLAAIKVPIMILAGEIDQVRLQLH